MRGGPGGGVVNRGISLFCGLYYKHVMIVNDASSGVIKWSFKLIDAARDIIYKGHMFIVQATTVSFKLSDLFHSVACAIKVLQS